MSGTDIGIAIVAGKHVLAGPFRTELERTEATRNEWSRVVAAFVQAGFFQSERPERTGGNTSRFAPGPNAEALLGFQPEAFYLRHNGGALIRPMNNVPWPKTCPVCGKRALQTRDEWDQLFERYGGNNLADSPIVGGEPTLPCGRCGQQVGFTTLKTSADDAAEYYGGTAEDYSSFGEHDSPPIWAHTVGRIIIEADGWSPEFDEDHVADTLDELLAWKDVFVDVTNR